MTFSPKNQSHFLVVYLLLFIFQNSFAESLEFPDGDWTQKNPSEVNISEKKVKALFDLSFTDSATFQGGLGPHNVKGPVWLGIREFSFW